jgi:sensor histidine kinase regulating citrate/malate metabolism
MLRHKTKQVVRDFAAHIRPGNDFLRELSIIKTQLECVSRLSATIQEGQVDELESFIKNYYSDLGESYPKVQFALTWKNPVSGLVSIPFATAIVLIISELIDNAISAMNGSGKIDTAVSILKSTNVMQIVVHDTGPGISTPLVGKMFTEGVSTKGEGRGLGLWLIREATRSLGGDVTYEFDSGAKFCLKIPIKAS